MAFWSKLGFGKPDPRKEQLQAALEENDVLLGGELAWPEIRAEVVAALKKPLPADVVFTKPRHAHRYLTIALWNLVTDRLTSGQLHIYRGTLSGRGQSYRNIAEELSSHLIAHGDWQGSQDEDELFALDEEIRQVG